MLVVRDMQIGDVPACVEIVNHIIAQGGTTAYEEPYTEGYFAQHYLDEPPVTNVVFERSRLVGFQAAFDVGDGLYSIGTFTDRHSPVRGAGRALFDKTLSDCRKRGGESILAKITSDNDIGLSFYSRLGFLDDRVVANDHTRKDGTIVDRVIKRFPLDDSFSRLT